MSTFFEKKQAIYYVVKLAPPQKGQKGHFLCFLFLVVGGIQFTVSNTNMAGEHIDSIRVPFPASYEMELSHEKNPPTFHEILVS